MIHITKDVYTNPVRLVKINYVLSVLTCYKIKYLRYTNSYTSLSHEGQGTEKSYLSEVI